MTRHTGKRISRNRPLVLAAAGVVTGAIASITTPAQADVLGTYNFTSGATGVSSQIGNLIFTDFTRRNVDPYASTDSFTSKWWSTSGLVDIEYVTFTVRANYGYQMSLTSLNFKYTRGYQNSQQYGPANGAVRASFENNYAAAGSGTGSTFSPDNNESTWQSSTWDFTDPAAFATGETVGFRFYGWNAEGPSNNNNRMSFDDVVLNGSVVAIPNNNSSITVDGTANGGTTTKSLGRIMLGSTPSITATVNKAGTHTTPYSATAGNNGLLISGADPGFWSGAQSNVITLQLQNNANGTQSVTGMRSWSATVANTATTSGGTGQGSADQNDTINVTATVVAQRTLNATTVNFGSVLRGTTVSGFSTTISTPFNQDDNNYSRTTLQAGGASGGGVTIAAAGQTTLFNSGSIQANRAVTFNFATSGDKSGSLNLAVSGEGIGDNPSPVSVAYSGTVYDPAVASVQGANNNKLLRVYNTAPQATGADMQIESVTKTAGDSGWTTFTPTVTANGHEAIADFDYGDLLNGVPFSGTFSVTARNAASITGSASGDVLNNASYTLSGVVTDKKAPAGVKQVATISSGGGLGGYSSGMLRADAALGTVASIASGTSANGGTLGMTWRTRATGEGLLSDVVDLDVPLNGTTDSYVLTLSYNEADLGGTAESELMPGYLSGSNWVLGGVGTNKGAVPTGSVGDWGVNTTDNQVWVVLNHASSYGVIVPEPATIAGVLGLGAMAMLRRRRNRKM